jgi:DNA polymerase-1
MRHILVDTEAAFLTMEAYLGTRRCISLDTEDTKLDVFDDDFALAGISLAGDTQVGYYIPVGHKSRPGREDEQVKQLPLGWVMSRLGRLLHGRRVSGANHKFDRHVFNRYATDMGTTVFDVLLAAAIHDNRDVTSSLAQVVFTRLGYKPTGIKDLCADVKPKGQGKGRTRKLPKRKERMGFEFLTTEEALPYAAADAVDVARLKAWYAPRLALDAGDSRVMQLETEVQPVITRMEATGILLDTGKIHALHDKAEAIEIKALSSLRKMSGVADLNPRSGKVMGDIVYHQMGIPHPQGRRLYARGGSPPKGWLEKDTRDALVVFVRSNQRQNYGGWSAAQAIEFLDTYTKYNVVRKMRSTYTLNLIDQLSDDDRLHTDIRQIISSGRVSSSSPNLQNIVRADNPLMEGLDPRSAFVSDPGFSFTLSDYNSQEMRVIAALSRDPTMLAIFSGDKRDERGDRVDIHAYVGSLAFDEPYLEIVDAVRKKGEHADLSARDIILVKVRQDSKPVNFGIAYGITPTGLAVQIKSSKHIAAKLIDTWYKKAFPHAACWLDGQTSYLRQHLYTQTALGRKRRIMRGALSLPERKFLSIARQLRNHPLQGTAADITKQAMIRVDARLAERYGDSQARLALVIHDEIIVLHRDEIAEEVKALVEECMYTELFGVEFPAEGKVAKTLSKVA